MWLELPDEVAVLMQVVGYGVVTERLNLLLHLEVLVDVDLESAFHLLVVDLVLLASQFLLLDLDHLLKLRTSIHLETFVDTFFDSFHLLLHEGLGPLAPLHVLDSL